MPTRRHTFLCCGLLFQTSSLLTMHETVTTQKPNIPVQTQLIAALQEGSIDAVRIALLKGARVKTKSKEPANELPVLHLAARQNNGSLTKALLISPQAGPSKISKFVLKEIIPFMLCMKSLKIDPNIKYQLPNKDIIRKICSYVLPSSERLIYFVPITKLWTFNPFMSNISKNKVLTAILRQHHNQQKHALKQKKQFLRAYRTPYEVADRLKNKQSAYYLNPKNMVLLKKIIEQEYRNLLKMSK